MNFPRVSFDLWFSQLHSVGLCRTLGRPARASSPLHDADDLVCSTSRLHSRVFAPVSDSFLFLPPFSLSATSVPSRLSLALGCPLAGRRRFRCCWSALSRASLRFEEPRDRSPPFPPFASMSLKQELQRWSDALVAFDSNDYDAALALFEVSRPISQSLLRD